MPSTNPEIALHKRLEQRVRAFMLRRELWPETGPLVLAVSGGPDSTALLLLLARLAKPRHLHLHVAYFDHGLRPREVIEREIAFVDELSTSLGLAFTHGRGDVTARAKQDRTSIEDAARRERYEFLARVAHEDGSTHVATGHTASDQAETVLLHIIRGAGLDGLGAMSPHAAWPLPGHEDLALVRPLLPLTRAETRAYCAAAGIEPLDDETNASPDYSRNRVRAELLPLLRSFNPKIEDALVRLADAAREAPASQPMRDALAAAAGDRQGFSSRHVLAIDSLLRDGRTGDSVALPRSLRARRTRDGVVVEASRIREPLPEEPVVLELGKEAPWGGLSLSLSASKPPGAGQAVEVDAEAVEGMMVRRRRPGDRIQPAGMEGTKKLQDLLVDAHIPREERDSIPVFASERGIAWVGGLRVAEWATPQPGRPTLWLSYREA
jgi:tRNA(Ile)-lysidine synthase